MPGKYGRDETVSARFELLPNTQPRMSAAGTSLMFKLRCRRSWSLFHCYFPNR